MTQAGVALLILALHGAGGPQDDRQLEEAREATAKAFRVATARVEGEHEGVLAHLPSYSFTVHGTGYSAQVYFAKPSGRITHAMFSYEEDYVPDPRWADVEPWEALALHFRRLKMRVPQGLRLSKLVELQRGSRNHVLMEYERKPGGTLAPLWLDATLDAEDHRPYVLHAIDYPLTVSTEPEITKDQAVKIALGSVPEDRRGKVETELRVWFKKDHSQVLWWDVTVRHGDETTYGKSFLIDAHTGDIDLELGAAPVAPRTSGDSRQ